MANLKSPKGVPGFKKSAVPSGKGGKGGPNFTSGKSLSGFPSSDSPYKSKGGK